MTNSKASTATIKHITHYKTMLKKMLIAEQMGICRKAAFIKE